MQFVAEDPVHVVIRNEVPQLVDTSGRMVARSQRRLFAKFSRGTAPMWARDIGVAMFEFRKRPEGVTPEQWLAFFDSVEDQQRNDWTDEERQAIEEKLKTTHSVVLVERPKLAPPWPAYDKAPAAKIADKVTEDGYDPKLVLAYELENKARQTVVAALQELVGSPPVEEPAEDEGQLIEA